MSSIKIDDIAKVLLCHFSKIKPFDVKEGPIYAEFHADYDFDSPKPLGPPKIVVFVV